MKKERIVAKIKEVESKIKQVEFEEVIEKKE
jgi:hypothetical protein